MRLTVSDQDLVNAGVEGLIEAFLAADRQKLRILGVEHEYSYQDKVGVEQKGFIDLWGRLSTDEPGDETWFVADWKSSDAQWVGAKKERQQKSKQPLDYALALVETGYIPNDFGTLLGQYRCWSWSTGRSTVIPFRVLSSELAAHEERSTRWSMYREALAEKFQTGSWPKNDGGCRKFGPRYPCRLESQCWGGKEKPFVPVEALDKALTWPLSYSSRETLKRCPELYRWEQVEKALDARHHDEDRASEMGSALHNQLAEVWLGLKQEQED